MEVLLALTGKDFVITASDTNCARSIVVMKRGEDKSRHLNKRTIMLYSGEAGDAVVFAEYIQKNIKLYSMRHGFELSTQAIASFTRREMATSLRSRKPYQVNVLIGGTDEKGNPELYWIDHLSNMTKLDFAAHGYASYFCMSTMDRYWRPDLNVEEGIALIKKCVQELRTRMIVNLPEFTVKVADKDGIREIAL